MGLDGPPAWPKPCHPIWSQNQRKSSQLFGQMEHILGLSCPWRSTAVLCVLRLVKAWPHGRLLHPFWSSAGPAKGSTEGQFGSRVVQAWPKDRRKRPLLEKRDTWPKPYYLLGFRTVWVDLGRHWAAQGGLWKLHRRHRTTLCQHTGTRVQLGSMETVANGRKWTQMDGNFLKPGPDQRSKSI